MTWNKRSTSRNRKRYQRSPDFESGIIDEPKLAFGGGKEHIDPKTGLGLYGPYTLTGQKRPTLASIIVGIAGPPSMIADAEQWLQVCKGVVSNDGSQPFLYPHFPGFNTEYPFQCELLYGDTWRETIKLADLNSAVHEPTNFFDRVKRVVSLYVKSVEILSRQDPKPNVILCCIPKEVIDFCTVRMKHGGEIRRVKISKAERRAAEKARSGQLFLFRDMDPTLGIEDEEWGHQNLRRGLKAEVMQFEIPTQLVWPRTLSLTDTATTLSGQKSQDIATRAWNFTTASIIKQVVRFGDLQK
jgi:hypothetical protein